MISPRRITYKIYLFVGNVNYDLIDNINCKHNISINAHIQYTLEYLLINISSTTLSFAIDANSEHLGIVARVLSRDQCVVLYIIH